MRGKRGGDGVSEAERRIIPARAGQTHDYKVIGDPRPDHPRACGANALATPCHMALAGSSPRVRGKHPRTKYRYSHRRIIPARAGQTPCRPARSSRTPDHPRACGANSDKPTSCIQSNGSSPRVRGKPGSQKTKLIAVRIIPARAGQTTKNVTFTSRDTDHPRACGANPRHAGRSRR